METFSLSHLTKLSNSIPSLFRENVSFQTAGVRIQTGSSFQRNIVLGRALQKDEFSVHQSPVTQTVNRDRLIALFRRIQESISQGESRTGSNISSRLSTDDSSVQTSVLEFLHQSNSEQANPTHSEQSTSKGRKPKKEKSMADSQYSSNHTVTRPPSNFVKKSPIPSPTLSTSNGGKAADGRDSSVETRNESEKYGEMKLSELKVLAKERGIKGYSKFKKKELIELLRFHV
ncbi:hypothetical protein RND81_07G153600 [Saponaria officinalis]|uniref:Rho termination factor-like N-terminal domain-containing protein n=1 Tax=Saponaria officinalis TaxID=3572 RepID=A0AAW1JS42_SAPOF